MNLGGRLILGLGIIGAAVPLAAQQPAPPARPAADGAGILDNRVDELLREWSVRTGEIKSLYAQFTRTTVDKQWKAKEVDEGSARYLAPGRARLDIETAERAESHVLTDQNELWLYLPPQKKIKIFKLNKQAKADALDDGPLPFLFGAKPDTAKIRYRFEILAEDQKMVQTRVYPKLEKDRQNFVWCEMTLNKETFLPNQLKFLEPNNNEVTFTFKGIWTNIEINPSDFEGKRVKGWAVEVQQHNNEELVPAAAPAPKR